MLGSSAISSSRYEEPVKALLSYSPASAEGRCSAMEGLRIAATMAQWLRRPAGDNCWVVVLIRVMLDKSPGFEPALGKGSSQSGAYLLARLDRIISVPCLT